MANERDEGDRGAVSASGGERGRRPTCKASANEWLARVTVALHGHLRDAGREPAASPWALVLDTERCDTIPRPRRGRCHPETQVRRPQPRRRRLPRRANPRAHAVEATSHAVLVPDGPVHPLLPRRRRRRARDPRPRSRVFPTRVAARLDASGSTTAAACRAAAVVDDARRPRHLAPQTPRRRGSRLRAVLALTVSERGAPAMYDGDSLDAVVCLVRDAAARGGSTRRRRRHVFVRRFVGRDAGRPARTAGGVRGGAGTVGGVVRGYREDASRAGSYPGDEHHARVDSGVGARRRGREGRDVAVQCVAAAQLRPPSPSRRGPKYTPRRHRGVEASPRDARGTSGGARRRRGGRRGRRPGQTRRRERRARRRARPRTFWGSIRGGGRTREAASIDEDRNASMRRGPGNASMRRGRGCVVRLGRVLDYRSDARVRASRVGVVRRVAQLASGGFANFVEAASRRRCSPSCSTPRTTPSTGTDW